ncbi:MAG: hypothetical protein MUP26_00265 [Desulfobulbaceae bacterium]|nr:hypothetical protein [Desulfobulbaceae bacterium]
MERATLWFKCAAMHDPVRPVNKQPAVIGWEAEQRRVDLTIERSFKGPELLLRMKGWVTVDVLQAIDILQQYGKLKLLDDYDLVIETRNQQDMDALAEKLEELFGKELWLSKIQKQTLT